MFPRDHRINPADRISTNEITGCGRALRSRNSNNTLIAGGGGESRDKEGRLKGTKERAGGGGEGGGAIGDKIDLAGGEIVSRIRDRANLRRTPAGGGGGGCRRSSVDAVRCETIRIWRRATGAIEDKPRRGGAEKSPRADKNLPARRTEADTRPTATPDRPISD